MGKTKKGGGKRCLGVKPHDGDGRLQASHLGAPHGTGGCALGAR